MKNQSLFRLFVAVFLLLAPVVAVQEVHAASIGERLSGRIVLQVEDNGEGWYVYPSDQRRYYLGRPYDAWTVMRELGLGVTNADLERIPTNTDSWDGNADLINRLKGYILLQVEENGEAWYVSPVNGKRYYLGRPVDAFAVMRNLGLGITTSDLFMLSPNIEVTNVYYDGAGAKEPDEYVTVKNNGSLSQTLNTWTLSDADSHSFEFPSTLTLSPGQSVNVYTNQGELSFGNSSAIWNNTGDTATLRGANDALIDVFSY